MMTLVCGRLGMTDVSSRVAVLEVVARRNALVIKIFGFSKLIVRFKSSN
jgi:hypothetical protein